MLAAGNMNDVQTSLNFSTHSGALTIVLHNEVTSSTFRAVSAGQKQSAENGSDSHYENICCFANF